MLINASKCVTLPVCNHTNMVSQFSSETQDTAYLQKVIIVFYVDELGWIFV